MFRRQSCKVVNNITVRTAGLTSGGWRGDDFRLGSFGFFLAGVTVAARWLYINIILDFSLREGIKGLTLV